MPFKKIKNIFAAFIIPIIGGTLLFPDLAHIHIRCPFEQITGLPCPGCGMTRAVHCLLQGDTLGSFYYNPLAIPTSVSIAAIWVLLFLDILKDTDRVEHFINAKWDKKYWIPVIVIISATWVFNLYKYFYYH